MGKINTAQSTELQLIYKEKDTKKLFSYIRTEFRVTPPRVIFMLRDWDYTKTYTKFKTELEGIIIENRRTETSGEEPTE